MFRTFADMFKNKDIRNRIFFTLAMLFVFRFGSAITVPGVDVTELIKGMQDSSLFAMINMLGGGGLEQLSIFAMGVGPYITASIIIQLLSMDVIPALTELAKGGAQMAIEYLTGEKVDVKDYSQYDNGMKIVGTFTCGAQVIDKDNYQILVDNGTYTEDEIVPDPTPTPEATPTPEVTDTPEATSTPEDSSKDDSEAKTTPTPAPKTTLKLAKD